MESSKNSLVLKLDSQFDEIVRNLSQKYLKLKTEIFTYYEDLMEQNKRASKHLKTASETVSSALMYLDKSDTQSNKNGTSPTILKHMVLSSMVTTMQIAGELPRRSSEIEHL
jgi:exonuclease VII small subunit